VRMSSIDQPSEIREEVINPQEDVKRDEEPTTLEDVKGDEEPTTTDLLKTIKNLQLEQARKDDIIMELLSQQAEFNRVTITRRNPSSDPRRSTIYMINSPQRVNDRTSMGGILSNPSGIGGEDGDEKSEEKTEFVDYDPARKITTMKVKEPPIFQGDADSDVRRWIELIEDFMSCFSENEVMKVQKVMLYLGEGPRIFVKTAEQEAKNEGKAVFMERCEEDVIRMFLTCDH